MSEINNKSAELKLKRAKQQIEEIYLSISKGKDGPSVKTRTEFTNQQLRCKVVISEIKGWDVLDEWSVKTGECIHNLRSALDNMMFSLACLHQYPPANPLDIKFPIFQDRDEFKRNKRTKECLIQISAKAANLVEEMQPFRRDGSNELGRPDEDALVYLQWLSNSDKHRIPPLVVLAQKEVDNQFNIIYSKDDAKDVSKALVKAWTGPLYEGVVLFELESVRPMKRLEGKMKIDTLISLETNAGNFDLIQVLNGLHQGVNFVMDKFRHLFISVS